MTRLKAGITRVASRIKKGVQKVVKTVRTKVAPVVAKVAPHVATATGIIGAVGKLIPHPVAQAIAKGADVASKVSSAAGSVANVIKK